MKKFIMLLLMFLYPFQAFSYALNGIMVNNNDGTYEVTLENSQEEVYRGLAILQGDGTLTVSVLAEDGETYIGTATVDSQGVYHLNLRNNASGKLADGILELD